MSIISKQ